MGISQAASRRDHLQEVRKETVSCGGSHRQNAVAGAGAEGADLTPISCECPPASSLAAIA
jgi:hypothetical protein